VRFERRSWRKERKKSNSKGGYQKKIVNVAQKKNQSPKKTSKSSKKGIKKVSKVPKRGSSGTKVE